jgi:hypothetical protein
MVFREIKKKLINPVAPFTHTWALIHDASRRFEPLVRWIKLWDLMRAAHFYSTKNTCLITYQYSKKKDKY